MTDLQTLLSQIVDHQLVVEFRDPDQPSRIAFRCTWMDTAGGPQFRASSTNFLGQESSLFYSPSLEVTATDLGAYAAAYEDRKRRFEERFGLVSRPYLWAIGPKPKPLEPDPAALADLDRAFPDAVIVNLSL